MHVQQQKLFLYQLQNKREFEPFEAGHKRFHIHKLMPTMQIEQWNSLNFFVKSTDLIHLFLLLYVTPCQD